MLLTTLVIIAASVRTAKALEPKPNEIPPKALLVGCTKYDFHPTRSLRGPANDVALMHELLVERFGFDSENVHSLVETESPMTRPTRSNIFRELDALVNETRDGQLIVLFFAGHGSQQPDQMPSQVEDPEPDGMDEIFLPCDTDVWSSRDNTVRNSIVDDEFREWAARFLAKGAELVVLFDSCHSGSGLRGTANEINRWIEPRTLIPPEVLQLSKPNAILSTSDRSSESGLDLLENGPWTALYASLPEQTTIEMPLPRLATDARPHGLFTFTLCQALHSYSIPSYRNLLERIRSQYLSDGHLVPTPFVEGAQLDRSVFGNQIQPRKHILQRDQHHKLILGAGRLHGITRSSILEVYTTRDSFANVEGYVKVIDSRLADSIVAPCDADGNVTTQDFAIPAECRPLFIDFGSMRLRVAHVSNPNGGNDAQQWYDAVVELSERDDAAFELVRDPDSADWFISRVHRDNDQPVVIIQPKSSVGLSDNDPTPESLHAKQLLVSGDSTVDLHTTLKAISKVTNLLRLASPTASRSNIKQLDVRLEVLPQTPDDRSATSKLPDTRLIHFKAGDTVRFRVSNRSQEAVDFTLLFVDSNFGISAIFPRHSECDNRLSPNQTWISPRPIKITGKTSGLEHAVMIAVPGIGPCNNFSFLSQPTLASAQEVRLTTRGDQQSPFEKLLEQAAFHNGAVRGVRIAPRHAQPLIILNSWIVAP